MIRIEIEGDVARAFGPLPMPFVNMLSSLAGRKHWDGMRSVRFEASLGNIRKLKRSDFPIQWHDLTGHLREMEAFSNQPTQHEAPELPKTGYTPRQPLFAHQVKALALAHGRQSYGYLLEMGLGKTAIAIHDAAILHQQGKVTGVLILSPKGVHRQWIKDQIPAHIDPRVKWNGLVWNKKSFRTSEMNAKGLTFLSMNVDAIRTAVGFELATQFLSLHNGRSLMVVDESHLIKNAAATRTKKAWTLGSKATYRRIMTGTPIAKNIIDAWAQFKFLDERILGQKYVSSFRARYCIMGGWQAKEVVGQKNTAEFYSLIAPHSFRLTKDEALDLPPKVYVTVPYEMGQETKRHYKEMKDTFMTQMANGEIVDAASAAVAMLRLQQITCGYLNKDNVQETISTERLDVLSNIVEQISGKTVIWARFTADIANIESRLGREYGPESVVTYFGATSPKEREAAKEAFIKGYARFFVANPAAGGTGIDGLQLVCSNVIYYSNSFDALSRWQSEDRTHRMGTKGSVTYFDIVAERSVDKGILRNLSAKKSIASLTLDDIRRMIEGD